jgi:hypothetical protein
MSEVSDGSGQIPRRSPRTSDGGAPVSGALAIVLAVIAVVAGFFILRSISGDDEEQLGIPTGTGQGDGGDEGADATTDDSLPTSTASQLPTTTAAPALIVDGATVVVANANGIGGSAATMSRALEAGPGFTMGEPTDASSATGVLDVTVIYYDTAQPAAQPVADSVNVAMGGGATVLPLPAGTPPVASGDLGGAGVLVMLGTDKANKTLEELNPTANTAPVVVTNPPLSSVAE